MQGGDRREDGVWADTRAPSIFSQDLQNKDKIIKNFETANVEH